MVKHLLALGLIALAAMACDRGSAGGAPGPAMSSSAISIVPSAAAVPNDGTDPHRPILSTDDANFVDTRKGGGWSDRCFDDIKQGKWGWARAACDRGLALPEVDPKMRPLLLYNEGLTAKHAGDNAAARNYFEQSLAARSPTDSGRAEVEKELVSVGGQVPAQARAKTFPCNGAHCRADQICCPGGPPGTGSCMAYDPNSPMFCRDTWEMCDPATNEPCASPQRCKPGPSGRNPTCSP